MNDEERRIAELEVSRRVYEVCVEHFEKHVRTRFRDVGFDKRRFK